MSVILGYCDPLSVAPGETIRFMVSTEGLKSYRADIVRLICADDSAEGPGYKEEVIETSVSGDHTGAFQPIRPGSLIQVPTNAQLDSMSSFTIQAIIWPTTPTKGRQAIITRWCADESIGFGLFVDNLAACALVMGQAGSEQILSTGKPLQERQWYVVGATYDGNTGAVSVFQRPLADYPGIDDAAEVTATFDSASLGGQGLPLLIAAACATRSTEASPVACAHFNGKIDRPRLARCALTAGAQAALSGSDVPRTLVPDVVAAWDFSREISSTQAVDISANQLHGKLINLPTRGVTGHNWTGRSVRWRDVPEEYGAIHFHADDMYDVDWQPSFTLEIPSDMRSAVYAARLRGDKCEEYVPFFVRPKRGTTTADIAYLAPTATYMAYANYTSWADIDMIEKLHGGLFVADDWDLVLNERRELGSSMYDSHEDGSGICYGSRHRPMLTIRPKRRQLWNLNADSHITDWLEAKGYAYDVITDEDLHKEGVGLLAPYRVVITGSHPEYDSREMLDALEAYTHQGGRFVYAGANGFYWRIAFHPEIPGVIEVRRHNGTRNWVSPPGECTLSFDGEHGGIWRELGRSPNRLAGVGFTAEGFDYSTGYVRKPDSFDPRAAFIFEGIGADEIIGDFGSAGGGASGFEIDRADVAYGTPPHALLLASSEGHSDYYLLVLEDISLNYPGLGGDECDMVRADLVFFETPNGGAVFSTGSIAWAGSLAHNGYDNNVSRLTENVLRRFLDSAPFVET